MLFQNLYEQLKKFLEYMNTKHLNIKFTFEHEHNSSFSFLDVKMCRENNKLTTSVYRKPTFSGVFTNFKSFIPSNLQIWCSLHLTTSLL